VAISKDDYAFWTKAFYENLVSNPNNPPRLDYDIGVLGNSQSKEVFVAFGGGGQDANFGWQAQAEVRFAFTIQTNSGTQYVDAWWTDFNPSN
jgi:hypothetical protein